MKSVFFGYFPSDVTGAMWHLRWVRYAWMRNISPKFSPLIASPYGVDLSKGIPAPLITFPGQTLAILVNEYFAYNLLAFLSFPLSAITAYYLAFRFTRNKLASTVAGIIYAFSPYHFARAYQHIDLAGIQWMPLYVLFLFKLIDERTYRNAIGCALSFSLVVLASFYYGYFMIIFTLMFLIFRVIYSLISQRKIVLDFSSWKQMVLALLLALMIILPFTYSYVIKTAGGGDIKETDVEKDIYVRPLSHLYKATANIYGYALPDVDNPIFGQYVKNFLDFYKIEVKWENIVYLGYVPLILAIYGIINLKQRMKKKQDKEEKFTIAAFTFLFLMSLVWTLPPSIKIFNFEVYLPTYYAYQILPMFRTYARFAVVATLCLSVLAGIGSKYFLQRISSLNLKFLMILGITALIFAEFLVLPSNRIRETEASAAPAVYRWLAKQPGDFAIAEYPISILISYKDYEYLYYQRIHQKKLINGAPSRTRAAALTKYLTNISKTDVPGVLKYLGAKYVILHTEQYRTVQGGLPVILKNSGLKLIKIFGDDLVYQITAGPKKVFAIEVSGFYGKGIQEDGIAWGWADNNSQVDLVNYSNRKAKVNLKFRTVAFAKPRTLVIRLNSAVVKKIEVPLMPVDVKLDGLELRPDKNVLALWTPQGAQTIDSVAHNGDMSKVAFAFTEVQVE